MGQLLNRRKSSSVTDESFAPSRPGGQLEPRNEQKKGTTTMIPQMIRGPRTASATATQPAGRTCAPSQTRVSVLACEGRLTDADRDRIHDHLREAFSGLDRLYGEGCDQLSDECDDDGDCCRTYSDGSPVYSSVRSAGQFPPPEAAEWPDNLENR
jgi:hypothetical protein